MSPDEILIRVEASSVRTALLPDNLSFEEGAAAGLASCAALMCVETVLNVQAGERVLVLGGAGGVGSFAVQLAALKRARVIAPCLPEDRS